MTSRANSQILHSLLSDVDDLIGAHDLGKTGDRGRQWNLSGVNRAIVIMAISAWEAYIEHVVVEAVDAIKPEELPLGTWPSLKAAVSSAKGRFHTPNVENVQKFVRESIGLEDVTEAWKWQRTKPKEAKRRLDTALQLRHKIAHGDHPRPKVNHADARRLRKLVQKLADCTDTAIKNHLQSSLGVNVPW